MVEESVSDLEASILRIEYGQSPSFSLCWELALWTEVVKFSHAVLPSLIASLAWGRPLVMLVSCFMWFHVSSHWNASGEMVSESKLFEFEAFSAAAAAVSVVVSCAATGLLNHWRGLVWRIRYWDIPEAGLLTIKYRTITSEKKVIVIVAACLFVIHIFGCLLSLVLWLLQKSHTIPWLASMGKLGAPPLVFTLFPFWSRYRPDSTCQCTRCYPSSLIDFPVTEFKYTIICQLFRAHQKQKIRIRLSSFSICTIIQLKSEHMDRVRLRAESKRMLPLAGRLYGWPYQDQNPVACAHCSEVVCTSL